jgi:hypothetical protein
MKFLTVYLIFFYSLHFFAQDEVISPVLYSKKQIETKKRNTCSFDSTFIYAADTLALPFFDDFSKNHFQKYKNDYTNPTITSQEFFRLTDVSNVPLLANLRYTSQQTMRKKINVSELTVVDEIFATQNIKVGDLCAFPVSYSTTAVYPPYIIFDTLDFPNPEDTVWLTDVDYFQDSATQFFANLNDKNSYWLDSKAQHNYTNAVNPWTLGVVTFDGTDENGIPYQFGATGADYNDYLTSKPIKLNAVTPADSVYLSFLYQPKGFNDEPEEGDSLILEFFAPQFNQWFHAWSVAGSQLKDFTKAHVKITDVKYFQSTFQFRFKNYSGPSGAIDQFHVDYVFLRDQSGYQDTLLKDFSVIYPLNTLLKDYTQVPWDHFKNNSAARTNDNLKIDIRNTFNIAKNQQNGLVEISYQGSPENNFSVLGQDLSNGDINYLANKIYESFHDVSSFYDFPSTKIGDFQEFDVLFSASIPAPENSYLGNDSTSFKQRFYDCYAYDDGSAEAAYGPNGTQARLAYKFSPFEDDSLVGVKIRFVPSVIDVSNDLFLLTVWNDNNGKPGTVIYQDEFLYPRQPSYDYDDSLGFTNYYLKDFQKLDIVGDFYVGWRQINQRPLNVGFDWNRDNSDKIFYSINNEETWLNTGFEGSLLMRPIFSTNLNKTLAYKEIKKENLEFTLFPNPTTGMIHISTTSNQFAGILVYDLQGKLLLETDPEKRTLNINDFQNGIYMVKEKSSGIVKKIIKN